MLFYGDYFVWIRVKYSIGLKIQMHENITISGKGRECMKRRMMNSILAAQLAVVLAFSGCAAGNTQGNAAAPSEAAAEAPGSGS